MTRPVSLPLFEPRPRRTRWTCSEHGPIDPPGDVECPECPKDAA